MSERQDFIALDWVAGEIGETLSQAAQALEAYIANRDDATKLRFCLTHLHQVHGTLQMVEFFGAALLAEEMESVAESLSQNTIHGSHVDDALEVLSNAIAQLPVYLEKVKESRHGLPATLIPVLNDLRAVRGESLLSETVLFAPQMASSSSNMAGDLQLSAAELVTIAHKLRKMFQIALLGFIRGNDVKNNLNYLAKVCARLAKFTEGFPSQPLWKVCIAVLEGLLNGSIKSSVAVKILLRQVDRQIKGIIDEGQAALETSTPDDLLKNLLYYVARSKASSRYIQEIKADYKLENSLLGETELEDNALTTPDAAVMQSVVEALSREMKDIQLTLAEVGNDSAALTEALPLFRRVNDTMAILGMGSTLKLVQEPYARLAKLLATQEVIADHELQIIRNQIAQAETTLNLGAVISSNEEQELFNDSEEAQGHLDLAFDSVVRESRNGLEQAKEAIIEFVATQWNHNCLSDLPLLLNEIYGSLNMVPLTRAAQVIKSCEHYVSESLLAEKTIPQWQMLDTLADAIASIDYYLERLSDGNAKEGDAILDVAAESVAELGYPISETATDVEQEPPVSVIPVLAEVIPLHGTADQSEPEDEDYDPAIVEVFIEEAGEVLELIDEYLPQWQADHNDEEARSTIRRAFHTLKGSGRMVGATDIGELAWAVENMLNRVMEGSITIDQHRFDLIKEARAKVPELVTAFEQRQPADKTIFESLIEPLIERANALAAQQAPDPGAASEPVTETEAPELDDELIEIFAAEAVIHGQVLDDFIAHCKELAGPAELTDALQRALHTLKGSANMAGILPVVAVVTPLEYAVKELRASQLKVDMPLVDLLEQGALLIKAGIEQLAITPLQQLPGVEQYVEALMALFNQRIASAMDTDDSDNGIPPEALNQFLTESLDLFTEISGRLVLWQQGDVQPGDPAILETLMDRFIGHAESVNMLAPVEFGQQIQVLYRRAAELDPSVVRDDFFKLLNKANDCLIDMLDQIAGHQTPVFDAELYAEAEDFEFSVNDEAIVAAMTRFSQAVAELNEEPELEPEPEPEPKPIAVTDEEDEIDDEIIEIFLEEANDLLEDLDETIHGWMSDRGNGSYLDDLLRILHTLKGGARLAGMTTVGNLSHNFETSLIGLENQQENVSDDILNDIQNYQDQLLAQITAIKAGEAVADVAQIDEPEATQLPVAEVENIDNISFDEGFVIDDIDINDIDIEAATGDDLVTEGSEKEQPQPETEFEPASNIVPIADQRPREVSAVEIATPLVDPNVKKGPQEVVKVSASLLEELVNLAGETSISRGRTEEQVSELVFSLDEMQITVDRLQEQVRRLDMETEQQILYRQEQVESEGLEGFDPLEMDRYSQLQQLSRSLLESSSDLTDIKSTLADKSRDMETLLIQQSRINTELQEGLMRSQMVPFSRMVPRLRRIVRQISGELNKKVNFQLDNIEGELDRSVLERMVAPLEHMLRNAVDHGIESAKEREKAGKAALGNVTLGLSREGGEVIITLSDDGGGINLETVKDKAIERGLMQASADLTDHEILQFILQAGFSTTTEITQISGRGVGMDVVHSEIKQLGGTMDIDSKLGQGTQFVVRLPFTVSVNRALMVRVGTDIYAIPLNSIEGIVRVSPFELEAYYQPDAPMFEYAGQPYLLRYMGALLHRGEKPNLEGQSAPLPVVLVRGAEHSVAIQVDHLMGSREIVVKPLGPQFSMVQGLSGATVLGDGSVVVILDLLAMIRADASHMYRDFIAGQEEPVDDDRNTVVMVVDDSVTVRKVTSRLLERQGMDVVLAKDGVDAVTQLQEMEVIPDIMLLDIEMPRMDGFEVVSRVRHNSRLKEIPIIMITSRTGQKHRDRALSLGVNDYIGKPYQESVLLEAISTLTNTTAE